jgi:hypothetical protein
MIDIWRWRRYLLTIDSKSEDSPVLNRIDSKTRWLAGEKPTQLVRAEKIRLSRDRPHRPTDEVSSSTSGPSLMHVNELTLDSPSIQINTLFTIGQQVRSNVFDWPRHRSLFCLRNYSYIELKLRFFGKRTSVVLVCLPKKPSVWRLFDLCLTRPTSLNKSNSSDRCLRMQTTEVCLPKKRTICHHIQFRWKKRNYVKKTKRH